MNGWQRLTLDLGGAGDTWRDGESEYCLAHCLSADTRQPSIIYSYVLFLHSLTTGWSVWAKMPVLLMASVEEVVPCWCNTVCMATVVCLCCSRLWFCVSQLRCETDKCYGRDGVMEGGVVCSSVQVKCTWMSWTDVFRMFSWLFFIETHRPFMTQVSTNRLCSLCKSMAIDQFCVQLSPKYTLIFT